MGRMPSKSELQEFYFSGLLRNVNAILAGVYGDELDIPRSNRLRGERSDEVLALLIREESIAAVIQRVLSIQSRTIRQGQSSLHDLALAHTLLCAAQVLVLGKTVRASSIVGSSMLLGAVLPSLRRCYLKLEKAFPDQLPGELSSTSIREAIQDDWSTYLSELDTVGERERRATYIKNLRPKLTQPKFALGLFGWIVDSQLDDRSIEDFLKDR